jgi:hypothetical protein
MVDNNYNLELEQKILEKKEILDLVIEEVHKKIIGQEKLIRDLIIGLLT